MDSADTMFCINSILRTCPIFHVNVLPSLLNNNGGHLSLMHLANVEYVLEFTAMGSRGTEITVFRNLSRLLRITNFIVVLLLNLSTMKYAYA